jgi:hypothetical protein
MRHDFRSAAAEVPLAEPLAGFNLVELTTNGDWEGAAAKMNEVRDNRGNRNESSSQARKKLALLNQREANLRAQLALILGQKRALVDLIEPGAEAAAKQEQSER